MAEIDFVAVDVETANRHRHSICQIGFVGFAGGREVFAQRLLVDPDCDFDPMNSWVHGLTREHVRGADRFPDLHADLGPVLSARTVVAHSTFDQGALRAACDHHALSPFEARWVNTHALAKAAWPGLANYRLPTVARTIGHDFRHHDALEDARAAGLVALAAVKALSETLDDWIGRGHAKASADPRAALRRSGDGDGPLVGQCVVMTGDFTVPKAALADLIAEAGGDVASGVTKGTTMVVVGGRDAALYAGAEKSGKQLKAEALIAKGQPIALIGESELRAYFS